MTRATVLVFVFVVAIVTVTRLLHAEVVIEVSAGMHHREGTPIEFPLPDSIRRAEHLSFTRVDSGESVPVQVLPGEQPHAVWILAERLPAGETRRYRVQALANQDPAAPAVTCQDNGKSLVLRVGQKTVLKYHHKVVEAPIGIQSFYRRSGHIHPLRTPAGRAVTDDFPPDHPHQHGIFFAWVNTSYAGHLVDFWNQGGQTGQVEHVAIEQTVEGPVCAEFRARLRHSDINFGTTKPVLDETWTVRVYNFEQYFLVDLTSSQQCISAPLMINEYHYGGMALRGQRQWYDQRARENQRADREEGEQEFVFITSEGKDRIAGNHTRPRWVSLSGPVDGQFASVTVMGHPTNFRYPQPVRLHPTKPYFCFAPMVLGEFPLDQARAYVSRYRFFVHDGRLDQEANLRSWKDFAEPPSVRVVTDD